MTLSIKLKRNDRDIDTIIDFVGIGTRTPKVDTIADPTKGEEYLFFAKIDTHRKIPQVYIFYRSYL